jgi:hypothetical protein
MNLLFDFTVDKATKPFTLPVNLPPTSISSGMPLQKRKCWTSGLLLNHGGLPYQGDGLPGRGALRYMPWSLLRMFPFGA